jgi:hypothetical protein
MGDRIRRRAAVADLDHFGWFSTHFVIVSISGGSVAEEKHRLSLLGALLDNPPHLREKTHVEHAIDLIEHEVLNAFEAGVALFQQIEQTTRCRDDISRSPSAPRAACQSRRHPESGDREIHEAAKVAEGGLHLRRELTRRLKNEATGAGVGS